MSLFHRLAPEFPNDNTDLHDGAIWTCFEPTGCPRPVVRWQPPNAEVENSETTHRVLPAPPGPLTQPPDRDDAAFTAPYHLPPVRVSRPALPLWQAARPTRETKAPPTQRRNDQDSGLDAQVLPPPVRDAVRTFEQNLLSAASHAPAGAVQSPLAANPHVQAAGSEAPSDTPGDDEEDPFVSELRSLVHPFLSPARTEPAPATPGPSEQTRNGESEPADPTSPREDGSPVAAPEPTDSSDAQDSAVEPAAARGYQRWLETLDAALARRVGAGGILPKLLEGAVVQREELGARADDLIALNLLSPCDEGLRAHAGVLAVSAGWQAVLDGLSHDLGPCGDLTLDAWSAHLVAAFLPDTGATAAVRSELRKAGIAAFGLLEP